MSAIRLFSILFILFCNVYTLNAQTRSTSARLKDERGKSIDFGSIIVRYTVSGKVNIDYYSPDSLGYFKFVQPAEISDVALEINAIGYEPRIIGVSWKATEILEIVLQTKDRLLDEVHVRTNRKVVQKGDTTTFNMASFSNNNENTVEDLIKKLPGMSVDKEGNIKFNNKPIDRVMLEGDDLFDDNYKMLTKNLSATLIDQAEVINKFNSNSALAGITRGDQQILNLKLKNKNKIIKEGNVNLGAGGPDWRADNKINLLALSPKIKVLALGATNNIGVNPFSFIGQERPEYQNITSSGIAIRPKSNPDIFNVKEYTYPGIDLERNNFNNAKAGSVNLIYKLSQKLQMKLNTYLVADINKQSAYADISNINGDSIIRYTQQNIQVKNRFFQGYHLEGIYKKDNTSQLIYQGKLEYSKIDFASDLSVQGINLRQNVENKRISILQRLEYTKKLTEHHALNAEFVYYHHANPQKINLSRALFSDYLPGFGEISENGVQQSSRFPMDQLSGVMRLFGKGNTDDYHVNMGLDVFNTNFSTQLFGVNGNGQTIAYHPAGTSGAYSIQNFKRYLNFFYRLNLDPQFNVTNDLTGSYDWLKSKELDKNTTIIDESYANIEWRTAINYMKKGSNSSFSLQYRLTNKVPSPLDLIPLVYIADYRTLQQGSDVFRKVLNHSLMFSYSYSDYKKAMVMYNATLSYNTNASGYLNQLSFQNLFDVVRQVPYEQLNNALIFANGRVEKYIGFLSGNLFLDVDFLHTNAYNLTNSVLNRSGIINGKAELGFRSAWDGKINLSSSVMIRNNTLNIHLPDGALTYANHYLENRFKVYYALNEKINFELGGEHYGLPAESGRKHLLFLDAGSRFMIRKDKFYIDLSLKNMLNEKTLTFNSVSALRSATQQYNLLPGYVMAKVFYKF